MAELERDRKDGATALRCVVITVSSTCSLETDDNGVEIARILTDAGHTLVERSVVPEEPARMALVLRHWIASDADAVIVNGGTGLRPGESAAEIAYRFIDRELPAFAQIFHTLAYEHVGAQAILGRAVGGVARGKAVFVIPGERWATDLCVRRLILPELVHLITLAREKQP